MRKIIDYDSLEIYLENTYCRVSVKLQTFSVQITTLLWKDFSIGSFWNTFRKPAALKEYFVRKFYGGPAFYKVWAL